jgi:hypothetical protein
VACEDGKMCNNDSDCKSKVCDEGTCQPATCDDDRANGKETDIDCGPGCDDCDNGSKCTSDEHCSSGACVSNLCVDPGCTDKEQNGSETDVDCGGECPACNDDLKCKLGKDCRSGICAAVTSTINRCVEATCDDGEINGRESDLNCGGTCDPCGDGKRCFENSDCSSHVCKPVDGEDYSQCAEPSCEDDVRNGSESAPDCGGNCDPCNDESPCRQDEDCKSKHCDDADNVCLGATCDDDRQNQGESDEDCGGPCNGCDVGKMCVEADDCITASCEQTCQLAEAGGTCEKDEDCVTGACADNTCGLGYAGDGCYGNEDCALESCENNKCPKGYTGDICQENGDCFSGACIGAVCGLGGVGDSCDAPTDCVSNTCTDNTCVATRMNVRSAGVSSSSERYIKNALWLRANADDPSVTWGNVAILYYFTPEAHGNFWCKHWASVNGSESESGTANRFLALQVAKATAQKTFGDWVAVWRALSNNSNPVATNQESNLELQIYNEPGDGLVNADDHSYFVSHQNNPNIVVCIRRGQQWVHAQGNPPAGISKPCASIVDACPEVESETCDPLEWRQ